MPVSKLAVGIVFGLLSSIYLAWSSSSILGGFGGDNAFYLLMAKHFSPYSSESLVAASFTDASFYPPLFPFLLGLAGGGENLLLAHLVTTCFLLATFAVFYWWLREEQLSVISSIAALITLAAIPGIYFQTLSVHSENLFMLCSVAGLAFAIRAKKENSSKWMVLALVSIAAAYFTRSAGIALIAAWLVWVWLNRLPHRLLLSAVAITPVLIWSLLGKTQSNGYLQQLSGGYDSPATFLEQIGVQSLYLFQGWAMNFGIGAPAFMVSALFLAASLTAVTWRIWLRKLDGYYVAIYVGMAVVWPFPSEAQRLSLTILPVLLVQTLWMLNQWRLSDRDLRPWPWAALLLIATPAAPELALNLQRFFNTLPQGVPSAYRHAEWWYSPTREVAEERIRAMAALESGMRSLQGIVPESECVYAIKPSIVAYFSDRMTKAPPGAHNSELELQEQLISGGCRYFFLMIYTSPSYPVPLYPHQRIEDRLEIIQPIYLYQDKRDNTIVGAIAKLK